MISVSDILFPETKNIEMKKVHNINQGESCIFKRKIPEIVLIIKLVEIIIISKKATSLRKKLYNWEDTNNNRTKKENSGEREKLNANETANNKRHTNPAMPFEILPEARGLLHFSG